MHIKFLDVGTGEAKSAERYLLQSHDHKGEVRPEVRVLRGNPSQVTAVADSLDFKHRYRSAVIAFHKDDQPTEDQINELLDKFEQVAFAGLDSDQYCYYAVSHGDHIHIIAPRVELTTGKSMNIAPPNWQKSYDPLRDYFNEKYNWAKPDDPARKRVTSSPSVREAKSRTKAKEMIDELMRSAVEQEIISSQQDTVNYLESIDGIEVSRVTKSAISVKIDGFEKPLRLKGAMYERQFDIDAVERELAEKARGAGREASRSSKRDAEELREQLESVIAKRAEYNQARYRKNPAKSERYGESLSQSSEQDIPKEQDRDQAHIGSDRGRDQRDRGESEANEIETMANPRFDSHIAPNRTNGGSKSDRNIRKRDDSEDDRIERSEAGDSRDIQRGDQSQTQTSSFQSKRRKLDRYVREKLEHDRIRAEIDGRIEATKRDVQTGAGRIDEAARTVCEKFSPGLHRENERSDADHREASRNDRDAAQHIGTIQQRSRELRELRDQYRSRAYRAIERAFGAVGKIASAVGGAIKAAINRLNSMSWGMRL